MSIYITNSSFSFILSIKQDCMGMATNSQTSKCKVLHENGSIPLSITVCVHICPYFENSYLPKCGQKNHYCKNVFEHFWREKNDFNMDCTIIE